MDDSDRGKAGRRDDQGAVARWNGDALTFRRADAARAEDLRDVLGVLDEAAGWLRTRGVRQWPPYFEAAGVADGVARGETWLVGVGDKIAGTVTLDWSDPLWTGVGGEAAYVHRLAVRRSAPGLGALVLDWAAHTARRHGARALRLDCVRSNARLRAYYEARGFAHRGDVPWGAPGRRRDPEAPVNWHSRYELTVAPVPAHDPAPVPAPG